MENESRTMGEGDLNELTLTVAEFIEDATAPGAILGEDERIRINDVLSSLLAEFGVEVE